VKKPRKKKLVYGATVISGPGGGSGTGGGTPDDNSVSTAKIQDGAVTAAKIASNAVTTAKINAAAVTYAKIQNVSATDMVLGRSSAGAGVVQEIACTAAGRTLIAAADAAAERTALGLATVASSASAADLSTGTLSASRLPALTGEVTSSAGSAATTIANNAVVTARIADNAVTLAKLATIAQQRIIGGAAGAGTATPTALTPAQIVAVISGSSSVVADGNSGSTKTIDWGAGAIHTLTLTANCTLTFTAPSFVGRFSLTITQDSTPRTITWPGSVRWPGGTAQTLSTGSGAVDKVTFEYDGTHYDGVANAGSSGAFA